MEGDPSVSCPSTSPMNASPLKIWPTWVLRATHSGGTTWNRPTDFNITVNTGNRNTMAAAGSQSPQGTLVGGAEITGNITLYMEDEMEFNRWRGASALTLYARWYTEQKLTSGQNVELGASLPFYFDNVSVDEDDGAFTLSADVRTAESSDFGIGQFQLISGTPGRALNATAAI